MQTPQLLRISEIAYGDRYREDFGDLPSLKESIKEKGLIQSIAVKAVEGGGYLVLAGGRRWKACMELDLNMLVPCLVFDHDLSELELREIELEENLKRKDMSWPEEVKLKKKIHDLKVALHGPKTSTAPDAPGWSQSMTADLIGETRSNTGLDLKLAGYLDQMPELEKFDNKKDAMKALAKVTKSVVREEIAKRAVSAQANTPLEVLRKNLMNSYIISDFLEGVKQIPDKSVDIVEIDPPYAIDLKEVKRCWATGDGQHDQLQAVDYNEISTELYMPFMTKVLKEANRCLRDNGWLILWFGPDPWFQPLLDCMRNCGFRGRGIPGVWTKNYMGQTLMPTRYLASAYELFFYAQKGDPSIVKMGRNNVFSFATPSHQSRIHPTERPVELLEEVLGTFALPNARVMVPFLGSGNTLLAAANLGMQAFGFDLTEAYKNAFINRVVDFTPKTLLPKITL